MLSVISYSSRMAVRGVRRIASKMCWIEHVQPAALQLAVDVARLLDDAVHAPVARRPG